MSHWTGWGQWLALITMTVDHITRYLLPDGWDAGWASSSIGRIAFPLFSAMVAWHGLFNTRNPLRYAKRILIIGLVAQLPYMTMPRDGFQLNICFTLAAGLAAGILLRNMLYQEQGFRGVAFRHPNSHDGPSRQSQPVSVNTGLAVANLVMLSLAWWVLGDWVEYGHLGLAMIPLYMLAFSQLGGLSAGRLTSLAGAAATLPVLLNAGLMNSSEMAKSFTVATSLTMVLLAAGAWRWVSRVRYPMPRRLWLAWYPAHFAVIALLLHWPG
ncbi:TraX family protein [Halomonas salinarum]|uniref:TraX family protein n=1 Tax=Halomonas salinarum TaxID=1158993 RepID=UPI00143CAE06|nr:TraX family protein [Halomonas salinarum]